MRGEPWAGTLPKPRSRAADKKQADREKDVNWRKVRTAVLVRDHYKCRCCGAGDKVDVHHMRFRSVGGSDSENNCVALCRICHLEMHAYRMHVVGEDANKRLRFERSA